MAHLQKPDRHIDLSDEELLTAYRTTGDNQWLGGLLQRYTALLLGVALKYLKDKDESEDAVQQVFIKAITHLPAGQINNFKGWLYILMRNHCLQQLRDTPRFADESLIAQLQSAENDKEELQRHEYSLQQMEHAIEELGEEQNITIVLFYLKKYSYEQIMTQTGYTFMQVKSHIQNGKRNLKAILLKKLGGNRS